MAHKIWTAAELDLMTPAERDRIFRESIVGDPDNDPRVRPEFLAKVRARVQGRIDAESADPPASA